MRKYVSELLSAFGNAYSYVTAPSGLNEWLNKVNRDLNFDTDSSDNTEDMAEEEYYKDDEHLDDNPIIYTIIWLYNEGHISEKSIKKLFGGLTFGSSCYGDYRKILEKDFNITFE